MPSRPMASCTARRAGFDFNDDRDGVWWEGTAQAALVYHAVWADRAECGTALCSRR